MKLLTGLLILLFSNTAVAAPTVFEETIVEGEVQKPEIAVYIGRQNLSKAYKLEPLRKSFLPKIIEALKKPPF